MVFHSFHFILFEGPEVRETCWRQALCCSAKAPQTAVAIPEKHNFQNLIKFGIDIGLTVLKVWYGHSWPYRLYIHIIGHFWWFLRHLHQLVDVRHWLGVLDGGWWLVSVKLFYVRDPLFNHLFSEYINIKKGADFSAMSNRVFCVKNQNLLKTLAWAVGLIQNIW